jgi:hypothetical protein
MSGYSQGQVGWSDYNNSDFQITIWSPQTGTAASTEVQGNSPGNFGTGLLPTGPDIPPGTQTAYAGVPLGGAATGAVSPADYANGRLWSVQLYAAPGVNAPADTLTPVSGAIATMYTVVVNQGLYDVLLNPDATIPGVPPGEAATLQLRAWYNGNGAYTNYTGALNAGQPTGQSTTGTENLGGGTIFPPDLPGPGNSGVTGGITSFSLAFMLNASNLIDVAFTGASVTGKTGFAAIGATPNDFWNTYVVNSGSLPNLEFANGTASGTGLTAANENGASTNGASDPMYDNYLYSNAGDITVTVTNLSRGVYNVYLYGHGNGDSQNGVYELTAGSQSYGTEATTNGSWLSAIWQEGVQYVLFTNVSVFEGQTVTITAEPGAAGISVLAGLQMHSIGSMPVIAIQPADQEAGQGATATFNVLAVGAGLEYQWLLNNADISSATNSAYTVTNAQSADVGNYSVIVANPYGSVTSQVATLTVIGPSSASSLIDVAFTSATLTSKTGYAATGLGPDDFWNTYDINNASLINLEFQNGTLSGAGLAAHATGTYGVFANGASDPMYGVYWDTPNGMFITVTVTNLIGGNYDFYLYGHGNVDDQNGVYKLTAGSQSYGTEATTNGAGWLSAVWQEGVQYVEFTNVAVAAGQTVTITAEPGSYGNSVLSGLQIAQAIPIPAIGTQPLNQEVNPGSSATFSVGTGGAAPLAYQWLFDNAEITGATNSSYSVTNAQRVNDGQYSVVVTNAYGSVTSQAATLTVINIAITTQPASQLVYQGASAPFSVVADTTAPLAYQWLFNNSEITGATNSSYSVASAQPADAGNYSVILTNLYGSLTSQVATLTVTNISILTQPVSQSVIQGANAAFSIVANAGTSLAYQWLYNNADISDATNSSYTVANAQPADSGSYFVVLTNLYGGVTSQVATLTVLNSSNAGAIINVAFTDGKVTSKVGLAAAGGTSNDFWNTCADSLYPGPAYGTGAALNLQFVDGSASGAGLTVAGANSFYGNGVSDPMYGVYLVNANREITVTVTNLLAGEFDFYLYGHGNYNLENGVYQLTVGSLGYGTAATTIGSGWNSTVWQEGAQYVEFTM